MFNDGMSRISAKGNKTVNRANLMGYYVSGQTYASADLDSFVLQTGAICILLR
ncbi:hypothetical protein AJ90_21035 [Vibrio parahaemolyticus M0605]|nr:hypothetical protein AJ90_21035 [Vibrio parahaemolyticus M0605]